MAKKKLDPIEERRERIDKMIEKLEAPENQKWPKNFKTQEKYDSWIETKETKLRELREEYVMLDAPDGYDEVPLATVAGELGISLDDVVAIAKQQLFEEFSFRGPYADGWRVTRDEFARAVAIGGEELTRLARQTYAEMFEDGLRTITAGDTRQLQKIIDRLEPPFDAYELWLALNIGYKFLEDDLGALLSLITEAGEGGDETLLILLPALRRVVDVVQPRSHLAAVLCERIIALVEGTKPKKFADTYYGYGPSEHLSAMDENQRHAMLLSNVVLEAIKKYKFTKWLHDRRHWKNEEQIERVIRNAIYTALEAEDTYYESPSSRLFVDKFVDMFPKRWIPSEHLEFLPATSKPKSGS